MSFAKSGLIVFVVISVCALAACKQEAKSVDYYMKNGEERQSKILECHNSSSSDEGCDNAFEALKKLEKNKTNVPRF